MDTNEQAKPAEAGRMSATAEQQNAAHAAQTAPKQTTAPDKILEDSIEREGLRD